jgi:hypothetical protein
MATLLPLLLLLESRFLKNLAVRTAGNVELHIM